MIRCSEAEPLPWVDFPYLHPGDVDDAWALPSHWVCLQIKLWKNGSPRSAQLKITPHFVSGLQGTLRLARSGQNESEASTRPRAFSILKIDSFEPHQLFQRFLDDIAGAAGHLVEIDMHRLVVRIPAGAGTAVLGESLQR